MGPAISGAGAAGAAQPDFVLRGVRHEYRPGAAALAGIDLTVLPGQHVAVVGANGSGKSTLLKMLDGLVFPSAGEILAFGAPLTEDALEDPAFRRDFRARVGFVFQDADVQLFCSDVRDELAFGPLQLGLPEDEVERLVAEVAAHLRIEKLLDRPPYSLSGGEKKRVAIAAIVTMQPHVLLLDEPTSALDPRSQVWLLDVLDEWKREGRTVVMATHDLSAAAEAADRIVVLSEEHAVVADGDAERGAHAARPAALREPDPRAHAPPRLHGAPARARARAGRRPAERAPARARERRDRRALTHASAAPFTPGPDATDRAPVGMLGPGTPAGRGMHGDRCLGAAGARRRRGRGGLRAGPRPALSRLQPRARRRDASPVRRGDRARAAG